jgi:CubicO group peptidase (beta-lactamase class C family)
LAYAVFRDGKLLKASAFGCADLETRRPWRFDTICRLYSMTKTVAVCGLMSLVEEGLIRLEDPVAKFLPSFRQHFLQVASDEQVIRREAQNAEPRCPITLKHLVTHCSGLSYGPALSDAPSCPTEESYCCLINSVDSGEVCDLADWCERLAELPLRCQPGERWEYSYGVDVVGRIIEVVSGKRLSDFLEERILGPLGMHDTRFTVPAAQRNRLASFYRRLDEEQQSERATTTSTNTSTASPTRFRLEDSGDASVFLECGGHSAANSISAHSAPPRRVLAAGGAVGKVLGGLVSTLNDFLRLCLMLQNEGSLPAGGVRVLQRETVQLMSKNLLPEVLGRSEGAWCLETPGLGFGVLGSVAVPHPDANWYDVPGEIGWGGLAGTAWAVDHRERLVVVTFTQVMYELWVDEEVRKAVRLALGVSPPDAAKSTAEALSTPQLVTVTETAATEEEEGHGAFPNAAREPEECSASRPAPGAPQTPPVTPAEAELPEAASAPQDAGSKGLRNSPFRAPEEAPRIGPPKMDWAKFFDTSSPCEVPSGTSPKPAGSGSSSPMAGWLSATPSPQGRVALKRGTQAGSGQPASGDETPSAAKRPRLCYTSTLEGGISTGEGKLQQGCLIA